MINKFKKFTIALYYNAQFIPNFLSIFINPNYIVRKGIYNGIKVHSSELSGCILDFGCGRKPYLKIFNNCEKYIGLDIKLDDKFNKYVYADVYYDGISIPFDSETFDNIVSFDVIQLIENSDEILLELNRVLKEDGYLLITVPFVWIEHWDSYDLCRYTIHGIENKLKKNGFSIESKVTSTSYLETLLQMFITFLVYELFPNNKILRLVLTILFITPLNLLSVLLNMIKLKNSQTFYNNSIILAKKIS
jgi:SAM-dependent methyltransferase